MFILELEPVFNNEGAEQSFEYLCDMSDYNYNGGYPFENPVKVEGIVLNSTDIVTVKAKACFTLCLSCDRCAGEFVRDFTVPVEHTLVTHVEDETNDELIVIDSYRYDIDPLVKEDIILSLPTKVLCKDGCLGICAQCGKNLNAGPCECKKATDPRWDALSMFDTAEN